MKLVLLLLLLLLLVLFILMLLLLPLLLLLLLNHQQLVFKSRCIHIKHCHCLYIGYSDNGLSTGEIAGISIAGLLVVVVVVVVVIVVIFVPYCCTKKCNNVPESKGHTEVCYY